MALCNATAITPWTWNGSLSYEAAWIFVTMPMGSFLVPIAIFLFFSSTSHRLRHPVFLFNILACLSGIVQTALAAAIAGRVFFFPHEPYPERLIIVFMCMILVSSIFVDSILLFRLLAFYPSRSTAKAKQLCILAVPVLAKCLRAVLVILFLDQFRRESAKVCSVLVAILDLWWRNPYLMADKCLTLIDNTYSSSVLIYNLYKLRTFKSGSRNAHFLSHVRTILIISLGNFVFPVVLNVATIILLHIGSTFLRGSLVVIASAYFEIFGVVFATVWVSKASWNEDNAIGDAPVSAVHSPLNTCPPRTLRPGMNPLECDSPFTAPHKETYDEKDYSVLDISLGSPPDCSNASPPGSVVESIA